MQSKIFFKSFIILAFGGFLSKALGAVYKIPLLSIIGSEAVGVYQLIFPLYSLLLVLSSASLPILISKKISEYYASQKTELCRAFIWKSLLLYGGIGLALTAVMAALSPVLAMIQGEKRATLAYFLLSPSVFLVCTISVFRGYFQGREQMSKTAISQVLEQAIKMALALLFSARFMPDISKTVGFLALAITASELATAIYLAIVYVIKREKVKGQGEKICMKQNVKSTLYLTLGAIVLPVSQIIDSVMVIRILSRYIGNAVSLYGLYSGGVMSLINLPVGIIYSLAISLIPRLSREKGNHIMRLSVQLTMVLSVFFMCVFLFFTEDIIALLYPNSEQNLLVSMTRAMSPSILFLSLTQTLAYALYGLNQLLKPAKAMAIATAVKIVVAFVLLNVPALNIFGSIISANLCYLLASILNLVYIIRGAKIKLKLASLTGRTLFYASSSCAVCFIVNALLKGVMLFQISLILSLVLCVGMYFGLYKLEEYYGKSNRLRGAR